MVEIDAGPEISLEALQAGDRVEFARLVDAYSTQIYRLALKMLAMSRMPKMCCKTPS
jgi:hypothetical protein